MSVLQAIILGVVQGITEFLPISSSAHLTIVGNLFNYQQSIFFDVMLHAATLIIIVYYFRNDLWKITTSIFKPQLSPSKNGIRLLRNLIITTLPAVIITLLLKDYIELYTRSLVSISVTLIIVGILLIKVPISNYHSKLSGSDLSIKQAFIIGVFQSLAFIRGVSRSGITLLGGIANGLNKQTATEYSFLGGIFIIGGGFIQQLYELATSPQSSNETTVLMLIGFVSALVSGYLSLEFLFKYIKTHDFKLFGYYRIILAIIIIFSLIW